MKALIRLFLILLILTISQSNAENVFVEAGERFNINPALLYSIAVVESSLSPYAIGVKGASCNDFPEVRCFGKKGWISLFPETKEEAVKVLDTVLRKGLYYDLGLMQISRKEIERRGFDPFSLLSVRENVFTGALILSEKIKKYGYTWEAVWRYNGRKSYMWKVRKVLLNYIQEVRDGR